MPRLPWALNCKLPDGVDHPRAIEHTNGFKMMINIGETPIEKWFVPLGTLL